MNKEKPSRLYGSKRMRCANCDSSDVQVLAWIDPNAPGDGMIIEWSDCQRGYCGCCEDEVYVDYRKESE